MNLYQFSITNYRIEYNNELLGTEMNFESRRTISNSEKRIAIKGMRISMTCYRMWINDLLPEI